MAQVVISGWKPGLKKIALTKLLQEQVHVPLRVAKGHVDTLLGGEPVVIEMFSRVAAEKLAHEATALGALAEASDVTDRESIRG